ncbi:hypothetical protein NL108_003634 [Boleophthalmus pectinirostris]|uniref:uncharacterized protein LOC110175146 n=1 Tax=Boleophthalmus pectinirostris TaxID=150288 RepID=UPI00242D021C|nr:uncharacterized protein LOC110175146 [Boleophthalmus pectinirostris]KAJ0050421.1 hypothetical protein NL108_003634 [Boleophthalmus pectinirostris]
MSTVGIRKRYTSAMERIIKNAVSESGKVLETIIAELKAEVLRVKSENENLKIRCSQFEEVVKKRSIYRETGTSPEPYIIERCDKAVQCELAFHQPVNMDPNISDNETQSECSFGPHYEKECSNDSFSFINMNEAEHVTYDSLDISDETPHEKSFDQERNTNDDKPKQKNKESIKYSETFSCPSDQVILTTSPQVELIEEHESCYETSEMEIQETCQEDVGIDCAKTDESFLECQVESQKEVNERITIYMQEEISTVKDGVTCEKSKPKDSCVVAQQQIEITEMEDEIDPQSKLYSFELKPDNVSSAITTNADQLITPSKVAALTVTPTGPEIDSTAFQSLSTEDPHARKAQKISQSLKYPYFLRRQRCTSVTLEDAMLLLDAVNLHEFKSSTPKKAQTKHSLRHATTTRKRRNNPEITQTFVSDTKNLEENACQSETVQPQMAEAIVEGCPANMGKEGQQHNQETTSLTIPSPLQAAIDHSILMVTPTTLRAVTETDSVSMDIEDHQHDLKILTLPTHQSSATATTNTTPNTTLTKQGEDMQVVNNNTAIMSTDGQGHDQITTTTPAFTVEPDYVVQPIIRSVTPSKQDETFEAVDLNEYPIESVTTCVDTVLLSTSTELAEVAHATADETQNNMVDVTPPSVMLPPESLIQSESEQTQTKVDETESVAPISVHSSLDIESQENDITFSLGDLPPKPPLNPVTQHTLLLKMPGETGDKCDSVLKTITSSSTLSPAQLSAVVSAVRSAQNTSVSTGPLANIPSGKKALVAVPFSLKSVMKPHHKIIVIPRQCKISPSQSITKDKSVVLKKKLQTDATTTVISNDVNLVPGTGDDNTTLELDKQQLASVTTQALPESLDSLEIEQNSPVQENFPCKNTAQVKLNRLPFPVSSAQTVSVANMSPLEEKNAPNGSSVKTINSETATSQPAAQPLQDDLTSTVIDTSPSNLSSKHVQTSPKCKIKSTSQSTTIVRLSPVVSNDHSYPQHRMTKSQFLAKLEVSPVTQDSEKAGSSGKDVPKASLVDRLRSHLKTHTKTTKKVQDGLNLTMKTTDFIPINQEISSPDQEQQSENVNLPTTLACIDDNKSACPNIFRSPIKTSPVTKRVSNVKQVKIKNSPKTDQMTPIKPVKKRRLKKGGASSENILLRGNLSPMRNKLINSNALLSCVRKGLMKKSFLCKFCRKEFVKKKDIEEHIQVHVGKKPFQCNICHRRFSRTMELSRHLKRHNAEKKYQCTSCGKAFIEYNNLKRHTYIHTGEKPYSCPHCPRAFTQSGHMRTHIKNHHKDTQR